LASDQDIPICASYEAGITEVNYQPSLLFICCMPWLVLNLHSPEAGITDVCNHTWHQTLNFVLKI
jgi:hypothetical protein